GLEVASGVEETDAVGGDVELASHFAKDVEEGSQGALLCPTHQNVATRGERCTCPGGHFYAVRQRHVIVAAHLADAFNGDGAVCVDRDDGAHLLQQVDEVLDLRLHRGVVEGGDALGHDCGEQQLFGGAHGRVVQRVLDPMQPVGRFEVQAVSGLFDGRAE